ncbi:hypothetical protein [Pseudorhodoferax sp.]|uniref:hypothetical protein n=1 Tax=Pseudorhodoferax sp. TaxID=1993553 RepID=UPI0039E62105
MPKPFATAVSAGLAALALLAPPGQAEAAPIYAPTPIGASPRFSDLGAAGGGWRVFDDFTPATSASVERVGWSGFWLDLNNPQPAPAPAPDVSAWDVAFYADAGGVPGALLLLQTFSPAGANPTLLGAGSFSQGGNVYDVDHYRYEVDLAAPLALAGGDTYWVSVMAHSPALLPGFAWSAATGGNDSSYQQQLGANGQPTGAQTVARDRAVTLDGTLLAVPEPAALPLAGLALLLLAALRRGRARMPLVR